MSFEHASDDRPAATEATTTIERHTGSSTPAGAQSLDAATTAPETARQLVRKAVLRGLLLDDPWRHTFLRNRWIGA